MQLLERESPRWDGNCISHECFCRGSESKEGKASKTDNKDPDSGKADSHSAGDGDASASLVSDELRNKIRAFLG
jgi:hypothetical protein